MWRLDLKLKMNQNMEKRGKFAVVGPCAKIAEM